MSLSPEEYREHLEATSVRAGFSFDGVVLPESHELHLGKMRVLLSGLGQQAPAADRFPAWRRPQRAHLGFVCLALRDEYHCIALDQRGHGDSDWSADADYSIAAQLADIKGFVDEVGLDKFNLIGMSMGAINSLAFAITYRERLYHFVLIDAGPEVRRPGSRRIRDFVNGVADPGHDRGDHRAGALVQSATRPEDPAPQSDAHFAAAVGRKLEVEIRSPPLSSARPGDTSRRTRALAEGLSRVACPTLVVRGAESDVFHDEDALRLAERLPDGKFVTVPRAGHTVQGDNPKDLAAELRRFLGRAN